MRFIWNQSVNVDARDKNGLTAIMYAAVNEHHKVMKSDLISVNGHGYMCGCEGGVGGVGVT